MPAGNDGNAESTKTKVHGSDSMSRHKVYREQDGGKEDKEELLAYSQLNEDTHKSFKTNNN
jgi:hypothetical protein